MLLLRHCSASVLILPVRNLHKGESLRVDLNLINPKCQINLYECDFASLDSVKLFAQTVLKDFQYIDILANNAGIFNSSKVITKDNLDETFQVNLLSQFILNQTLLPLLEKSESGRIVNLSSLGHKPGNFDIDNLQGEKLGSNLRSGTQLYFNSNLYRNLLTFRQANELTQSSSKVTVNCMHPGAIKTGLGTQNPGAEDSIFIKLFQLFSKPAEDGAKTLVYFCLDESINGITGEYWTSCKIAKASTKSKNLEYAEQLFNRCKELTNL